MKKTLLALITVCALGVSSFAQTTTNSPTPPSDFFSGLGGIVQAAASAVETSGLMDATNYAPFAYATYANSAADKIGGGFGVAYNFPAMTGTNGSIGLLLDVDWLGQWSMVSGNVTIKAATHPFNIGLLSWTPTWVRNIEADPLAIVGIGTPMSGGGGAAEIWDIGYNIPFGHWQNGRFGVFFTWGEWMNAGKESGHRYHIGVNYQHGLPW